MAESVACPVPPEQRPLEEFEQLTKSWFFSWPTGNGTGLSRALILSWLLVADLRADRQWRLDHAP